MRFEEPAAPDPTFPRRHSARGGALLVGLAAALVGFVAQREFAPTTRAALGFVLVIFAVTFVVSLWHSTWLGGGRESPAAATENSTPEALPNP